MPNESIKLEPLKEKLNDFVKKVEEKINSLKANEAEVSLGEMFEMQMLMNKLSQFSELCTQAMSGCHAAIMSMTRNLKQ